MSTLSTIKARGNLAEVVNQVAYGKERVTLTRRGKPLVAIVPLEDLQILEALEDRLDAQEALEALKRHEREGRPAIPWEDVKRELGL